MQKAEQRPVETLYFASPKQAVAEISGLLRAEDWRVLAAYYDLSDSAVQWSSLLSGDFFIRDQPPIGAHPGGFWRYRQPFAPSFEYLMSEAGASPDRVLVTVHIRIDQGEGSPVQEGRNQFRMRKSEAGYQLLPNAP